MSFSIFNIAATGMHAQRVKMDTVSSNIANVNTTRNEFGEKAVYHKKTVNFKEMAIKNGFAFPKGNAHVEFDPPNEPQLLGGVSFGNEGISKGVMVESITDADNPTKIVYDPSHPDADENGYVELPNVNVVEEMVNMVNASRAYEANITLAQSAKTMIQSAINI